MRAGVVLVFALGCGRLDFDRTSRGSPPDACMLGAWSAPQPYTTLESAGADWGGSISADGLGIYFDSDRTGTNAIYEAHRSDRANAFSPAVAQVALDPSGALANPTITGDQLEIFFDQGSSGTWCPYTATRATTGSPWTTPVPVFACTAEVRGTAISADGLTFYFGLWGTSQIAVSTRASRGMPFAMSSDVVADGQWPAISGDGLTMYTDDGSHVLAATRDSLSATFGPASVVPGIAAPTGNDGDPSITEDGLELDFTSSRDGGAGGYDLYFTTRTCM